MGHGLAKVSDWLGRFKPSRRAVRRTLRSGRSHLAQPAKSRLHYRQVFNVVMTVAVSFNVLTIGVPELIASYNDAQGRIPHPLAATARSDNAPATDSILPNGKAAPASFDLQAQLDADRTLATTGKAHNPQHLKKLDQDQNRTANDTIYANADGSKSLEHSVQATSYKDASGKWQYVDMTLAQDPADSKWKTTANDWQARFGSASSQGIEIAKDGQTFTMKPVGGADVAPTVTGTAPNQIVTYRNVWQGIDLQYMTYGSELKETIVVKSRVAPTQYAFTTTGANLAPASTGEAQYVLDGALAGFEISAPTVGTFNQGVLGPDHVTQTLSGSQVNVALDAAWLSGQAFEAFPITIDPTVTAYSVWGNYYRSFKSDGFICYPGQGCGNSAGHLEQGLPQRLGCHADLRRQQPEQLHHPRQVHRLAGRCGPDD